MRYELWAWVRSAWSFVGEEGGGRTECIGVLRSGGKYRRRQKQIPFGDDKQKNRQMQQQRRDAVILPLRQAQGQNDTWVSFRRDRREGARFVKEWRDGCYVFDG